MFYRPLGAADITATESIRVLTGVTAETINLAELVAHASARTAGAVVTFDGVVRSNDAGRAVTRLEYEAHPDAAAALGRLVGEFADNHPEVIRIAAVHRVGRLEVGDSALVTVVAAEHRSEAFAVCAELVELIKHGIPVWKRQVFADGTDEWVNSA